MASVVWLIEDGLARLQTAALTGSIDLSRPREGLRTTVERHPAQGALSLLGIDLPGGDADRTPRPDDVYVRGSDLVATYGQTAAHPARVQAYWRWREAALDAWAALDLEVSVQTSLLDSAPALHLRSVLCAAEARRLVDPQGNQFALLDARPGVDHPLLEPATGTGCLLLRPAGADWSYAEMIHPSDFCRDRLTTIGEGDSQRVELTHELFPERLEKGVIRRARVRALFVSRDGDQQAVADGYRQFADEEPPLTT